MVGMGNLDRSPSADLDQHPRSPPDLRRTAQPRRAPAQTRRSLVGPPPANRTHLQNSPVQPAPPDERQRHRSGSGGLRPCLEDPAHHRQTGEEEAQRRRQAQPHADVAYAVEGPAEARDQIDHRVEQGHRAPAVRQHVDRIEGPAEEGQRRHDQHGDHLQLFEILRPDADDEAEQAEGRGDQDQEGQHPEGVQYLQRHEQGRRRQNDQAQHRRLGRRRPDIGDDDLQRTDGRRQDFIDGAGEFREVDAEAGVEDRLGEQAQHDQPRHDEGAVGHAADLAHAAADGPAEDDEIEGRGDHRRDDRLPQGAQGPRHLEAVNRPDAMSVEGHHALSPSR
uniref:LigA n=1 Tax=Parastrongyloides trichosuri TaxID=131310 RepID=A0A0N4ZJL2_PARTI